jgi:hypothetical protein
MRSTIPIYVKWHFLSKNKKVSRGQPAAKIGIVQGAHDIFSGSF